MDTYEVKCAKCHVPVEGPTDPQPQDRMTCPNCGESDTVENINREVQEYITEQVALSLEATMREVARTSEVLKVTSHYIPKGNHRFVVDLNL